MTTVPTGMVLRAAFTALAVAAAPSLARAQAFDASWYDPTASYMKIGVVADGAYSVSGADLSAAGVSIGSIDPATLRLLERGREIPIDVTASGGSLQPTDQIAFVGFRNSGHGEVWAYNEDPTRMTSTRNSLYSDTTYYWLTWGGGAGLRYDEIAPPTTGGPVVTTTRADVHREDDLFYFPGQGSEAGNPIYTNAEGFYQERIRHNTSQTPIVRDYTFSLPDHTINNLDTLRVSLLASAETVSRHKIVLQLGLDFGSGPTLTPVDSIEWVGISTRVLEFETPQDALPAGVDLQVRVISRNNYNSATPNNLFIDWVNVDYVRDIRPVSGQLAIVTTPNQAEYRASGLAGSTRFLRPRTSEAFSRVPSAGSTSFALDASSRDTVYAIDSGSWLTPVSVGMDAPSNLVNPPSGGADYVLVTTSALRASAEAMAMHRTTATGGGHTAMVVDVQDIFDQFDYGRPTPVAIRRFVRAARMWPTPIAYLTLWGDALYADRSRPRPVWEVPSFGHTVSDGWYAMQTAGITDYSESIGVGRIPIRQDQVGFDFVDKIDTYESAPLDVWQKNAMFLAGGFTDPERRRLRDAARRWSSIVSDQPVTMDTVHFFKESPNVLDPTFRDTLLHKLGEGTSWMVYFGHSATQTWEIVTDSPTLFDNALTLPIVLSLGCFTGDFAIGTGAPTDILSFSEQLVVESANGSIAHWGASSSGTIGASERFSDEVHQSVFADSLRVLGLAIKAAKERYNDLYSDPISVKHLLQYGLVGDPATRIALPSDVDFRMLAEDIRISPFAPVPADDELIVDVTIRNIGLYPADTVSARLVHELPSGARIEFDNRIAPFRNERPLQVRVPIDGSAVGTNRIVLTLDADNELTELDETNNTADQTVTVFSTGLAVAEPGKYALFPTTDVTLLVNTSSADLDEPSVIFQIDTLRTFDSPSLVEYTAASGDLVASWQPPGLLDNQLYFWRVRINVPDQEDVWTDGSFTIRTGLGESGWYQAGLQFEDDAPSPQLAVWNNGWAFNTFTLDASASSERGSGDEKGQFVVNGQFYERLELGFGILLIDGASATVKASASGPTYANDFEDPSAAAAELRAIADLAEPGDYVMTRTRHLGNRDGEIVIPDSIRAIFRDLGSVEIDNITYRDLWIMYTQVGSPEKLREFVTPASENEVNEITEQFTPDFRFLSAELLSPAIGPATDWHQIGLEGFSEMDASIAVDVLDVSGSTVLLSDVEVPGVAALPVEVRDNPFIRLRATFADSTGRSTPQLHSWRVSFSPVPELAIDPASLALSADSVAVGADLTASVVIRNLSQQPADSVVVRYEVVDADNRTVEVAADTMLNVATLAPSEQTFSTEGFVGSNRLRIVVEQPGLVESITVNNVAFLAFVVTGDGTPPEFLVLVDGEALPHDPEPVMNLQDPALPFVSSQPEIDIVVSDDFAFFDFEDDSTVVMITLDDALVPPAQFDVAMSEDGRQLDVRFEPDLSARDSTHTLIVEVRDARGNEAEGSPHQVHFRVQNSMHLEAAYPYPNPMSNVTRFAFRLLGADASLVEEMVLRIYTVSGRVVRQFDLVENPSVLQDGLLKIGWNQIVWDGRDDDGDRVATGVYLYRLFARSDGESIDTGGVERVAVIR